MPSNKFSIRNATIYGALLGLAYSAFVGFSEPDLGPAAQTVGRLIGGAIGGALLFAGGAAIANLFRK